MDFAVAVHKRSVTTCLRFVTPRAPSGAAELPGETAGGCQAQPAPVWHPAVTILGSAGTPCLAGATLLSSRCVWALCHHCSTRDTALCIQSLWQLNIRDQIPTGLTWWPQKVAVSSAPARSWQHPCSGHGDGAVPALQCQPPAQGHGPCSPTACTACRAPQEEGCMGGRLRLQTQAAASPHIALTSRKTKQNGLQVDAGLQTPQFPLSRLHLNHSCGFTTISIFPP